MKADVVPRTPARGRPARAAVEASRGTPAVAQDTAAISRTLAEQLNLAQRTVASGVWEWDMRTGVIGWSEQFYALFGIDPATPASLDAWRAVIHPDDVAGANERLQAALAARLPHFNEYRIRLPDGRWRWIASRGEAQYDEQGRPLRMIGFCHDVTLIKDATQLARDSRVKLEAALASMNDAVFISDAQGRFVDFNDAFASFHRFAHKAECARTLDEYPAFLEVMRPDGSLCEFQDWAVPRALRGETASNVEFTLRRRDTGETWVGSYSYAPIRGTDGAIVGSVVSARDVTAHKHAMSTLRLSNARFATLFHSSPVAVVMSAISDGRILEANDAFFKMMQFEPGAVVGRTSRDLGIFVDEAERAATIEAALASGAVRDREVRIRRRSGQLGLALISREVIDTGEGAFLLTTFNDITERKRVEDDLRIAAIAFNAQEGMMVTDRSGRLIRVNEAFTRLTGYTPAEVMGKSPALLKSGRQDRSFYREMWRTLHSVGYWQGEMWNRRKDGQLFLEWLTISAVRAPDGTTSHFVGTFSDITKSRETEEKIHHLAYYDALTNLPNRRLLHDRLEQALAASSRTRRHGAVLFLDLDNFKVLNDTRGHDVGDELLVETAGRVRAGMREGDTVARLGGDEFVVLLENLGGEAHEAALLAGAVAEKLRIALGQPYQLGERAFHCGASIGIALFRGHDESVEAVLRHADLAMYQAKSAGRNALRFFDPAMQTALDERSVLDADLRVALERGQLMLHFQPQIDSAGTVVGAEALLRWNHPERGLVPPGDFIPVAEDTGLIVPIGLWVIENACARIKAWSTKLTTRDLRLAVNVSPRQFRQPEFVDDVRRALAHSGADPARLKIEITENVVISDVGDTFEKMRALKSLGIGFSLDDFGTGNSSLSYLSRLPLDELKIDKSFVINLPENRNDAIIAQTIITMAASLGLEVIAEGVETNAQRTFLEEHGCSFFQGYLFSRPLPLEDFEQFAARQRTGRPALIVATSGGAGASKN